MYMNYRGQAKLYYLYMMADGEVSYSEEKIFDEICRKAIQFYLQRIVFGC